MLKVCYSFYLLLHHEEKNSSEATTLCIPRILTSPKKQKRKMKLTISLHIFFPPVCRKSKVRKRKEKKKTERRWRDQDIGRNSDKAIADITLKKKGKKKKNSTACVSFFHRALELVLWDGNCCSDCPPWESRKIQFYRYSKQKKDGGEGIFSEKKI